MAIAEKYVSPTGAGAHDGSTPGNAFSLTEAATDVNAGGKAGTRYNLFGSFTPSATITLSGSGSSTSPVVWRGYSSSIGDGWLSRTNGNGPIITTNFPAITFGATFRLNVSGSWINLEALNITGNCSNPVVSHTADSSIARSVVSNSSTNALAVAIALAGRSIASDCDAALTGGSGGTGAINITATSCKALACRATGGAGAPAVNVTSTGILVIDSVCYSSTVGIMTTNTGFSGTLYGNTIVGNSSDGINIVTGTTGLIEVINNLITDNGGYGLNGVSAANAIFAAANRFDRNTSGATNLATDWLAATGYGNDITSIAQASEYSNYASNDYRLLTTAPGKGIGLMSYRDIGALQRQEAASSSGGYVIGG